MKIRITGATKKTYWYADKVGEEFDGEYGDFHGEMRYSVGRGRYVDVADCEIISETAVNNGYASEDTALIDASLLVLQREINGLKRKQTEQSVQIDGLTDIAAKLTVQLRGLNGKSAAVSEATDPLSRDGVIAKAKRDLEEVKVPWNANVNPRPLVYTYRQYVVDIVYFVNRAKRTVVAIARWRHNNEIVNRGIAKCAPSDVFNSHIGRAIALRRALGLEVPEEYVNAPQPTEPRVGDIVFYSDRYPRLLVTESRTDIAAKPKIVGLQFLRTVSGTYVIDDSRTDEDEGSEVAE